ncbi:MAG: hypothetical protein JWO36_4529 [Myxococcales bacterium]|nr:hypothetical protein [Myxococcales bacterium]
MHARLLFWSLRHRRWRHLLNAMTIAITASVVMLFVSVTIDLVSYVHASEENELTRIFIFPKMIGAELPMAMYPTLEGIDGVKVVQRYRSLNGRHESGATYLIVGEEDSGIELSRDFFPVEPDVIEAWKKERIGAIVTEATANDLRLKVGALAEIPTPRGPLKIKVVGISYGALIGQRIATHFDYLQEFAGNPSTCKLRVYTKPADYERVAREINERTENSATPVQAASATDVAAGWAKRAGMVPAVLGFLGLFLILTTALTLANNAAIAIRERRTETATMRVLGYHRSTIVRLMLSESAIIGLAGGLLAVVLCSLLFRGGVQLTPGDSQLLKPVEIGRLGIAFGLITSVLVPIAGALPSALAALRMPLVKALRDTA